jgi:hypothetical protein
MVAASILSYSPSANALTEERLKTRTFANVARSQNGSNRGADCFGPSACSPTNRWLHVVDTTRRKKKALLHALFILNTYFLHIRVVGCLMFNARSKQRA